VRALIFWTGIVNLVVGAAVQSPALAVLVLPSEQPGMMVQLFGAIVMFLGVMLVICTRDLKRRGSLVIWDGVLRIGLGVLMVGYGLLGGKGDAIALTGVLDFTVGLIYLVGLPRYLQMSVYDLLLDRG
jgi:hypothetical protein